MDNQYTYYNPEPDSGSQYTGGNGFQTQGPDQDPTNSRKEDAEMDKGGMPGSGVWPCGVRLQTVVATTEFSAQMIMTARERLSRHLHPVMQNSLLLQEAQCPRILPRSLQMRCLLSYPSQT